MALVTLVKASFEGTIKIHSGILRERIALEGESVDDLWCAAFDAIMFKCEMADGVLIGIVILSADLSREALSLELDQLN